MIVKGEKINDRYQIIRLIGEGGMANVYLAHDTILDRDVAVKVLRGDLATDEKFVRRFQREAISASSLSHPNIVEMYDVGEDHGNYYIVMEYVPGRTLKNLIKKRGALTIPEVIDIMLQLTSGVAEAHASYIIHRDLKPQNVLILDDGMVKITDFGIAMALNSKEITQTNSVMGSVHYLPPEQANGSGSTKKSDIYSLGIMMFELLIGKLPFKGDNAVEIAIKQMKEPIPSVCKLNPDIPQSIENIILKACAKNPKNRYDDVSEMHNDLEHALDEEQINVKRITYKYPEDELEETKKMPVIKETPVVAKTKDEAKKTNTILLALGIAAAILIVVVASIAIIFPKLSEVADVEIPNVSNMTVVEAEQILKKAGFTVAVDVKEKEADETITPGTVIGADPAIGRTVKKGTEITLIVAKEKDKIILSDYTGQNSYEIKGQLEANKINVIVETQKLADGVDETKYTANEIIGQSPAAGEVVTEGDTVTLYIPDIQTEYPDFVNDGWSLNDIEAFCNKYNVNLTIAYTETDSVAAGTILAQSRPAGDVVIAKVTLKITVAKKPTINTEDEPTDNE